MRCETTTSSRTGQWDHFAFSSAALFVHVSQLLTCSAIRHLQIDNILAAAGKNESSSAADCRTASGRTLNCRSFGDQQRAYLRGQLTVHKSIHKVNHIWRSCPHLSSYYRRIEVRLSRLGSSCTYCVGYYCRGWQTIGRVWQNAARAPLRLIEVFPVFFFASYGSLVFFIRGVSVRRDNRFASLVW